MVMKKLSFLDSVFLLAENRKTPMHVGGVNLFTLPKGVDEQEFLHGVAASLRTADVSWQASFTPQADFTGWFHLTATWSALGAKLYLDGVATGTPAVGDARSTSPAWLYLGTREQRDRDWGGLIDDVRFYDYAMTPSEVAALVACP